MSPKRRPMDVDRHTIPLASDNPVLQNDGQIYMYRVILHSVNLLIKSL